MQGVLASLPLLRPVRGFLFPLIAVSISFSKAVTSASAFEYTSFITLIEIDC